MDTHAPPTDHRIPVAAATHAPPSPEAAHPTASERATARCEPVPGDTLGRGPRMVPQCDSFFLPSDLSHTLSDGAMHASADPMYGWPSFTPSGAPQYSQPRGARQWPTPGAAYMPMQALGATPPPPMYTDPRDDRIMHLSMKLDEALLQIERLTPPRAMPRHSYPSPPRPGSPSLASSDFATITSSSGSLSDAPTVIADDNALLPSPAGKCGGASATPATKTVLTRSDIFSSHELKSLPCSCERDEIAAWDVTLMARLESKNAAAHKVLEYRSSTKLIV